MKRKEDTPVRVECRRRQNQRYHNRRAEGMCTICGQPEERYARCLSCRLKLSAWRRQRQVEAEMMEAVR